MTRHDPPKYFEDVTAYWAKLSYWTIEQSTALLIGENPDAILEGTDLSPECPAPQRDAFAKMRRLLDTHIRMSGIGPNISPTEILKWAAHTRIEAPPALIEAVKVQGRSLIEEREACSGATEDKRLGNESEKPLGERERNTLLRMIIGMAISGYGFDPDAKRSDIPKTIAEDLDGLGLECSDQTVRDKLKEARELLPGDWNDRRSGKTN